MSREMFGNCLDPHTHMLHGAGIFTYMTGSFFDGKCYYRRWPLYLGLSVLWCLDPGTICRFLGTICTVPGTI